MNEEELFLAALDLPDPLTRSRFLESRSGGDAGLRRRVEELLAAHFKPGPFLDHPADLYAIGTGTAAPLPTPEPTPIPSSVAAPVAPRELGFLSPHTRPDTLGWLGPYEVVRELGRGGFGIVFEAHDTVLQRSVALKVLAPALDATPPARQRFLREARATARVRHENIVQVYAVEDHPVSYLVMEFVPGETLQQRLDRTGPFNAAEVASVGRQLAEGLAAAHAAGLVHRDVKPCNVLIEEGPGARIKLTDFGLARAADDASLSQSGVVAGTPLYMAPEQARGEPLDHRADLFSLGSVLYAMATGRPPFRAATTFGVLKRVVEDTPRPIRDVVAEQPEWLCEIVARLQAKNPTDRYPSARAVADVFADCEAQLAARGEVENPGLAHEGSFLVRARRRMTAAAVLLVVAIVARGFFSGSHSERNRVSQDPTRAADAKGTGQSTEAVPPGTVSNFLGMKFVLVPAGRFTMGSPQDQIDRAADHFEDQVLKRMIQREGPAHQVTLTRPFYLAATEVTVGQFRQFVALHNYDVGDDRWKNPGWEQTDAHPVVGVSWTNAVDFCRWLSARDGQTYRLPLEAEWEYACRAGRAGAAYCFGDDEAELAACAWYGLPVGSGTRPVGTKRANAWGLYDMHGNAWEWCQDVYAGDYYQHSPLNDPIGPAGPGPRVQRGGGSEYRPVECRAAFRSYAESGSREVQRGFRVVRVTPTGPTGAPD